MARKIAVITGSRAEYGLLQPVMERIKAHPQLKLFTIVTGMHLLPEHGETWKLIAKDKFRISAKINMLRDTNTSSGMASSLGVGIYRISRILQKLKPDLVLILGDRIEAFAGASAASYMNIPLAHIHGGDRGKGDVDERIRHAITKISHIHFAATKLSAQRIIRMGEDKKTVFVVGAPGLDTILNERFATLPELLKETNIDLRSPWILVLQHPVTTEPENARFQMQETLESIKYLKIPSIVIYPNADAGGKDIIKVIQHYEYLPYVITYRNMPRYKFLGLLKNAFVMVGNSSCGIIESAVFKLPVINLGIRQNGREKSTNVIDTPHNKNAIVKAIKKALFDKHFRGKVKKCKNPYGNGHASERIVRVLSIIKLDKRLLQKQIVY